MGLNLQKVALRRHVRPISLVLLVGLMAAWWICHLSNPSGEEGVERIGQLPLFIPYNPESVEWEVMGILGHRNGNDPPIVEADLREAEVENAVRVQRVRNLCRKFHLGKYHLPNSSTNDLGTPETSSPRYESSLFFLLRKWKFSYCPVSKAGGSSMRTNLLLLGGYTREEINLEIKTRSSCHHTLVLEMYDEPEKNGTFTTSKSQGIEDSVKLLVVRHPLDRLLSAYLDKLANFTTHHDAPYFIKNYAPLIVEKYRTDSSLTQPEPTWTEFVEYLLNTDVNSYDRHWRPFSLTCTPCLVNYDIIAKIETYSRDQAYFIHKLDLTPLKEPIWVHQHQTLTDRKDHAQVYFGQLTKTQIRGLVKIYLMDLLLFDYSPKDYMEYGKED